MRQRRQGRSFAPREELPLGRHLAKRLAWYFGASTADSRRDSFSQVIRDRARALRDFLALYRQEPQPLARLAQTGRIVQQAEHLHRLLDSALANTVSGDGGAAAETREPVLLARWRYFWLRERQQRVRFFDRLLLQPNGPHWDFDRAQHPLIPTTEAGQLEVLTLLRDDLDRHGGRSRHDGDLGGSADTSMLLPMEQELAERASALVSQATNMLVMRVPAWFTSRFDLAAQRSRWQQAPDLVVHHLSDPLTAVTEERCVALAHNWARLAHPLVAAMRGACHVGSTPFVVYERGPTLMGSLLRDQQQQEHGEHTQSSVRWRALYEAALALRFLHSRGVAHETLSCSDILVSSSLTTSTPKRTRVRVKMAGYNLREACEDSKSGAKRPCRADRDSPWRIWRVWQWLAPERIMGAGPSAAADVFSLGMCVLEAARVGAPWGGGRDDEFPYQVGHRLVLAGLLPPRSQGCRLSDRQWALVQRMCAFNPRDRADLSAVISELRDFAKTEEEQEAEAMVKEKELARGGKRKQCALDAVEGDAPAETVSRVAEPVGASHCEAVVATAGAAKRLRRRQ